MKDQSRMNAFMHLVVNLPSVVKIETRDKGNVMRIEVEAGPAQHIVLELNNIRDTQVRELVGTFTEGDNDHGDSNKIPRQKQKGN